MSGAKVDELRAHAGIAAAAAAKLDALLAEAATAHRTMTEALVRTRSAARAAGVRDVDAREIVDRWTHSEQVANALARGGVPIATAISAHSPRRLGDLVAEALQRLVKQAASRDAF
jgi:hypothetical protein